MEPIKFKGQNIVFAENQPQYKPLPAFISPDGIVLTCWKMTVKERLKLLFSGRFYLQVMTFNQGLPPMLPTLENPLVLKVEESAQ